MHQFTVDDLARLAVDVGHVVGMSRQIVNRELVRYWIDVPVKKNGEVVSERKEVSFVVGNLK